MSNVHSQAFAALDPLLVSSRLVLLLSLALDTSMSFSIFNPISLQ